MLQGLGGAAIGLPLLEAMLDAAPAAAATPSPLFITMFGGHSLGNSGASLSSAYGLTMPAGGTSSAFTFPLSLKPLEPYKQYLGVFSDLLVPVSTSGGGRPSAFHHHTDSSILAGKYAAASNAVAGPTADQIARQYLGDSFLSLRVQASNYDGPNCGDNTGYVSWQSVNGSIQRITPTVSPRQLFTRLFGTFVPPTSGGADPAAVLKRDQRVSVLDKISSRATALKSKLPTADAKRIDQHLEQVRAIELDVQKIETAPVGSTCVKPADPGADPAMGSCQDVSGGLITYNQSRAYSNEDQRAKVLIDMTHMAMVCGMTNIAAIQLTCIQCFLNMYPLIGVASDMHQMGHGAWGKDGSHNSIAKGIAWHSAQMAYLLGKFANTADAGGKLIDRLSMVYQSEGGYGAGEGESATSHSTEHMVAMVAGGASGLSSWVGKHTKATGKHPGLVTKLALNAAGVPITQFGDVTGSL